MKDYCQLSLVAAVCITLHLILVLFSSVLVFLCKLDQVYIELDSDAEHYQIGGARYIAAQQW